MLRFFVNKKETNFFELTESNLNNIKIAKAENFFICIFREKFYITKLENKKARIIKKIVNNHEFKKDVTLGISFISDEKIERLIQSAAELGLTTLIPIISEKISFDVNKKLIKWNKIAINASEQSFRNKSLIIKPPMKFIDIVKIDIKNKYIAHEGRQAHDPGFFKQDSLFLVGPEEGFSGNKLSWLLKIILIYVH